MTPLARKLRCPPGGSVAVINAPRGYTELLDIRSVDTGPCDLVQLFVRN